MDAPSVETTRKRETKVTVFRGEKDHVIVTVLNSTPRTSPLRLLSIAFKN